MQHQGIIHKDSTSLQRHTTNQTTPFSFCHWYQNEINVCHKLKRSKTLSRPCQSLLVYLFLLYPLLHAYSLMDSVNLSRGRGRLFFSVIDFIWTITARFQHLLQLNCLTALLSSLSFRKEYSWHSSK